MLFRLPCIIPLAIWGLLSAYDSHVGKLNAVQLCGIKTVYWRQFLKAFQESTTDGEARLALERLRRRIQKATNLLSPRAQSALAIVAELEGLLDMEE